MGGDRECPACHQVFQTGDYTVLIPLGPGADPESRKKRDAGRVYNAVAVEVHFDCAGAEHRVSD